MFLVKVEKGRDQFSVGQVPRGAVDDQAAGSRNAVGRQALAKGIFQKNWAGHGNLARKKWKLCFSKRAYFNGVFEQRLVFLSRPTQTLSG